MANPSHKIYENKTINNASKYINKWVNLLEYVRIKKYLSEVGGAPSGLNSISASKAFKELSQNPKSKAAKVDYASPLTPI